jgi:hypothetical protein
MGHHVTKIRTNTTKDSICDVKHEPIKFATLWANYPDEAPYTDSRTGKPPDGYENQCAIKVSVALHKSGGEMRSFRGKGRIIVNGKNTAGLAEPLASWLKLRPFCGCPKAETITGKDWAKRISGRTGIIFFENYWTRKNETEVNRSGDHIDLWNGARLTASGFRGTLTTVARFTIGASSIPGLYSDLSNSTQILFWEVK